MDESLLLLKNQVCFPIYSASKLIIKAYKPFLDELGITYPQYLVFLVLWKKDKLNVNQIKEQLMLDNNTLSPMLLRMEKMELLNRSKSSKDERSIIVSLTKKGKALKIKALPIPEKLLAGLLKHNISLDEIIKLKSTLDNLVNTLTQNSKNNK